MLGQITQLALGRGKKILAFGYWQRRSAVVHLQVRTFTDEVIGRPRKAFYLTSHRSLPKISL